MASDPKWCHGHAWKMKLQRAKMDVHRVIIEGSAAKLEIFKAKDGPDFQINWTVIQCREARVSGVRFFSADALKNAFGLVDTPETDKMSEWMLGEYGVDVAHQSLFVRKGDYLNIPGPGTGHDGDPNISIEINEEMQAAVVEMLVYYGFYTERVGEKK